jgi:Fic family protein
MNPGIPSQSFLNLIDRLLPHADRALGRLDGALALMPERHGVAGMLRRTEAVASGNLEGIHASLLDLLDAETGLAPVGPARDVAELAALSEALAAASAGSPTANLLASQLRIARAGGSRIPGWRRTQLWVGAAGSSIAEARFVPPPAAEVPRLMLDWEQFCRSDPAQHPLLKLSLTFSQLESIHPFQEANGRLARIFILNQLRDAGLLDAPALLWSCQMLRDRQGLLLAQQSLRTQGDVDQWVIFFLKSMTQAANETVDVLRRIASLLERHRQDIRTTFGRVTPQALTLIDALTARPVIGIKDVIELTGATFPSANELTGRFVRAGMLTEITGNARNRRFRYAPYVRIFLDHD